MISVAFAFNVNIQRCEIEVGEEKVIVDKGYRPLIELFIKHGMKADLFFSGYSTEKILELDPDLIETVNKNKGGHFELGTYTYTHPIPQLLTLREFEKQIEKGLEIDNSVFNVEPEGFLPPEFAFSKDMASVLKDHGLKWVITLDSHIKRSDPSLPDEALHQAYTAQTDGISLTAVPAVYQLPETPQRFFKKMMKGELEVEPVVEGVRKFARQFPGSLLLFKRDAETIFIDYFNSGFEKTFETFDKFLSGLSQIPDLEFSTIGEYLGKKPPEKSVALQDHLGNTKIETFTEGEAKPIWDLTQKVRDKLLAAEKDEPKADWLSEAWEHLLLSHNSDGRIGYWFSEWNPGEHKVAPTRRQFIEDNLNKALSTLEAHGY